MNNTAEMLLRVDGRGNRGPKFSGANEFEKYRSWKSNFSEQGCEQVSDLKNLYVWLIWRQLRTPAKEPATLGKDPPPGRKLPARAISLSFAIVNCDCVAWNNNAAWATTPTSAAMSPRQGSSCAPSTLTIGRL